MNDTYEAIDLLVEKIPIGMLIIGSDGELKVSNRPALQLLDLSTEDLIADSFVQVLRVTELQEALFRVRADAATRLAFTTEVNNRSIKCCVWRGVIDQDDIAVSIEDATEFRRMDALKRDFLSTMLHRIRGPVSTLKTTLSILSSPSLGPLPAEVHEIMSMGTHEVKRLSGLLDDLRDLFFIETGLAARDLEEENFLVDDVVKRAIQDLPSNKEEAQGLTARLRISGCIDAKIKGDFSRVKQALLSVLKNAVMFSPDSSPVDIVIRRHANSISIQVRDRGIGIATEQKGLLFTKFFREDNAITRSKEGNGLGLYIARSFLQLMGGSMHSISKQGMGTTIDITVPASEIE